MKLGMWTSFLIELSPEEMVSRFAEKGWHHLELSDEHGAALLERGKPSSAGQSFKHFASAHGVAFPQGHLWLDCDIAASDQTQVMEKLKQWLDLFLGLDIHAAVIHPGGQELLERGCVPEKLLETRVRALRVLSDYVKDTDMVLCLENVTDAPELADLLTIINAASRANLAVCLDTGHLNMASGNQTGFIRKAGPLLRALHINDNDAAPDQDQHLMPYGHGTVPWPDVASALKEIQYDGLFNLEIPGEMRCPLPVRLAKLDYLKNIMPLWVP